MTIQSPIASPIFPDDDSKNKRKQKRKRRQKNEVWRDPVRKTWCANGRRPDGSRWRRYGFHDQEAAEKWRQSTIDAAQSGDPLTRQAVTLPEYVLREVAAALNEATQAGLNPNLPGFWREIVGDAIKRTPSGKKITVNDAVFEWRAEKTLKPRSEVDMDDCIDKFTCLFGLMQVSEVKPLFPQHDNHALPHNSRHERVQGGCAGVPESR